MGLGPRNRADVGLMSGYLIAVWFGVFLGVGWGGVGGVSEWLQKGYRMASVLQNVHRMATEWLQVPQNVILQLRNRHKSVPGIGVDVNFLGNFEKQKKTILLLNCY